MHVEVEMAHHLQPRNHLDAVRVEIHLVAARNATDGPAVEHASDAARSHDQLDEEGHLVLDGQAFPFQPLGALLAAFALLTTFFAALALLLVLVLLFSLLVALVLRVTRGVPLRAAPFDGAVANGAVAGRVQHCAEEPLKTAMSLRHHMRATRYTSPHASTG
jgi:hypothetical protein